MKKIILATLMMVRAILNATADNTVTVTNISVEKKQKGGSSDVSVDFPLGTDSPLRRAIIDYIFERCKAINPGVEVAQPSNMCDEATFRRYLEEYTTTSCRLCAEDQQDYAASFVEEGTSYDVEWFSNFSIEKVVETDLYVSYAVYWGEFVGGAHDNRGSEAVTLRKPDGVRVDSIFREGAEEEMQPLLWKYLIESEQPDNVSEFVAEIKQFLEANYSNSEDLHLPYGTSYLAPDGVHILYQPLEICFWAMGSPIITIPFEAAKPFLTLEAARLAVGK